MQNQDLSINKYIFHRAAFSLFERILIYQMFYDSIAILSLFILIRTNLLTSSYFIDHPVIVLFAVFIFLVLKFVSAFLTFLDWHSDVYEVKKGQLFHKSGVFSTQTEVIAMEIIEEITYTQSFFGRIFGYATVKFGMRHNIREPLIFQTLYYIPNHLILIDILENSLKRELLGNNKFQEN